MTYPDGAQRMQRPARVFAQACFGRKKLLLILVSCVLQFQVSLGNVPSVHGNPEGSSRANVAFAGALGSNFNVPSRQGVINQARMLAIARSGNLLARDLRCRRSKLNILALRSSADHGESESSSVMCQKLTTSFRKVWLQLYTTGLDEQYLGSLRCFVSDAVAAYDEGFSISALMLELNVNELETRHDRFDRSERLTEEERRTREVWLFLVYSTLARLKYIPKTGFITATPEDKIGLQPLVEFTCAALEEGFTLDGLHLEMALRQAEEPLTPAQLSLRAQWIRIIYLTNEAMKARKQNNS